MTRILTIAALAATAFAAPLAAQQEDPAPRTEVTRSVDGYLIDDRDTLTPKARAIFDRIDALKDPSER